MPAPKVSVTPDSLILKFGPKKYVSFLRYGVVIFWGLSDLEKEDFINTLDVYLIEKLPNPLEEDVEVIVSKKYEGVKDGKIYVHSLDVKKISLISIIIGRSVALDYYEVEVDKVFNNIEGLVKQFTTSKFSVFSHKDLIKKIGFALNVKYSTISKLSFLDKPDTTWEDATLDKLYSVLSTEYELHDRYSILNEKITAMMENFEIILDIINVKKTTFLEAVIVLLFILDIVILVLEKIY